MTQEEDPQSEDSQSELKDQFRNLGNNIKNALNAAWDSQERQKVQDEIGEGLNEIGDILENLVGGFRDSEPGQKFVEEMDNLSEKFQTGEMQAQARENLMSALEKINSQLEKAADKFTSKEEE